MPFNNLAILRGQPIKLDEAALNLALITEGLGGYCFEQNGVLLHVLNRLGYKVTPLGARVMLDAAQRRATAHFFLRVDIDQEPWLIDRLRRALAHGCDQARARRGSIDSAREATHRRRRWTLLSSGIAWWRVGDCYEFTLDVMHPIDREVANWWTSTSPASRFTNNLIVARAGPSGHGSRSTTHVHHPRCGRRRSIAHHRQRRRR